MIDTLTLPFQFAFMQNAFWVCLILGPPTALMSCLLVLKGWSLMGDAISHAILPGVVLAYLAGLPLMVGAFGAGMVCALSTGYIAEHSRLKQDTVLGVVFSGMFGFGLVLFANIRTNLHLNHILFGDMLGIGRGDLISALMIGGTVFVLGVLKWKDLLLHAFDPTQARASGLPVTVLHYALLTALSLTIVATLKAVGLILAIGLLIGPGAIAFLLTRRFSNMLVVAVVLNTVTMLLGVWASFFLDSAPAPTIILLQTAVFVIAFVVKSQRAARVTARPGETPEAPAPR